MIKIPMIEILFRVIPEGYILLLGMHILSHVKVKHKILGLLTLYSVLGVVVIRSLPISPGIHTIAIIIMNIFLVSTIRGVEVTKTIKAGIGMILALSVSEWINILFIEYVLKKDIEVIFSHTINKIIYGIPSMMLLVGFVGVYYLIHTKGRKRRAENGTVE